jgi:hypothetical protein
MNFGGGDDDCIVATAADVDIMLDSTMMSDVIRAGENGVVRDI